MKIAQVCPYDFSRPGGVKIHIVSLSKLLVKLGHQVKIIAPKTNTDEIRDTNVHLFGKNQSRAFGGTKIDLNIALSDELKSLKQFMRDEEFDIIHYHTFWNPVLPLQIRLISKKARHIATFHDTPKNQFVGKTIMPLAAKVVFSMLDRVISVSNTQASYLKRFSKQQIDIIPNGIDLEQFQIFKRTQSSEQIKLLFLGRLEPRKGLMHALEVYRELKNRFPQIALDVLGNGDLMKPAKEFAYNHQLPDLKFHGAVDEETKIRFLTESDILLAPALYGESFGIVLLEAMACGLPIAGFANEGYKNVITEEMRRFFVEPGDIGGMVSAVENLISSKSLRKQAVDSGLLEVKKYDWAEIASRIEKVYKEVISVGG